MPSDTARKNAAIANSIVTDYKNERRNFDGPGNSDAKSIQNLAICVDFVLFVFFLLVVSTEICYKVSLNVSA